MPSDDTCFLLVLSPAVSLGLFLNVLCSQLLPLTSSESFIQSCKYTCRQQFPRPDSRGAALGFCSGVLSLHSSLMDSTSLKDSDGKETTCSF